jgi:hypothetical protein
VWYWHKIKKKIKGKEKNHSNDTFLWKPNLKQRWHFIQGKVRLLE